MTLHQLRLAVGDDDFFRILRRWTTSLAGGHSTTAEFIELSERVSGQRLDALFDSWLFTPGKPVLPASRAGNNAASGDRHTAFWRQQLAELRTGHRR